MDALLPHWGLHPDWLPAAGWAERKPWPGCWLEVLMWVCSLGWSWSSVQRLLHSSALKIETFYYTLTHMSDLTAFMFRFFK